ncbi:MAG: DUF981 family protein [candidate division WOR-3 bacterium]
MPNYISLMLIGLSSSLIMLALFLISKEKKKFSFPFILTSIILIIPSFHLIFNWPLEEKSYNILFGEPAILLGMLMFFAGLSLILEIDLFYLSILGFIFGLLSVELGVRIINLKLTYMPILAGIGYVLTGICGIISPFTLKFQNKKMNFLGALLLISSSFIWIFIGFLAYWLHLEMFLKKGG